MENCTNYELQLLVNKLNSSNIPSKGIGYNKIEIFYNESNKDIIFNLLNKIRNNKIGYQFTASKNNDTINKSIIINLGSRINITTEHLTKFLKNLVIEENNFTIIDNIINNYLTENIEMSIQDNMDYKNSYLITFNEILKKTDIENNNTYVVNNNLTNNIIHTIVKPEQNGKYKITYRLLYNTIEDLKELLPKQGKIKRLYNDQIKSL